MVGGRRGGGPAFLINWFRVGQAGPVIPGSVFGAVSPALKAGRCGRCVNPVGGFVQWVAGGVGECARSSTAVHRSDHWCGLGARTLLVGHLSE